MARISGGQSRATSRSRPTSPTTTSKTPSSGTRSRSTVRSASRPRRGTSTARATSSTKSGSSSSAASVWVHTPSQLTLVWLAVSVPLVVWDIGYVLLRPYSMPGGTLHSPLWKPYAKYSAVDLMYGWKAFKLHNGFTAAQTWVNVVECLGYAAYLWIVFARGRLTRPVKGRGTATVWPWLADLPVIGELGKARTVGGADGASAALLGFACALTTLSKTVLYFLNEACSGFEHTRHNDFYTLIFFYLVPRQ